MRTLFLTQPPAPVGDQQFIQSGLDAPLSAWRTFGLGVRDTFEQSLLGTMAREASTPDTARKPVAGGKGGIQWRYESDAEVEARGDTLYETPDAYKASPFFREKIPYEPGMTESRARALAEADDLRSVRQFYMSKRPVVSALGGVAGAALAPENYIPVLGELAAAATTARIGKIAGRALTTGADAALNTAAFQLLTRDTRERLGDDVSAQAIAENVAFAAAAGTIIGGLAGGLRGLRRRYHEPVVESPPAVKSESPRGLETPRAPEPIPEVAFRLDMPETPTAQLAQEWRITSQALDLVETPAARAKAAAVMNDAVVSMSLDGEVRLGEQAQANLDELRTTLASAFDDVQARQEPPIPDGLVRLYQRGERFTFDRLAAQETSPTALRYVDVPRDARFVDLSNPEAPRVMLVPKKVAAQAKVLDRPAADLGPLDVRAEALQGPRAELLRTKSDFTVPAPEPRPAQLDASYNRVDSLPKAPDPAARAVEEAKAEGFDPETGVSDLDADIDILRTREALTADDEAALAAADETIAAAKAWGEVAEQLILCKASGQ